MVICHIEFAFNAMLYILIHIAIFCELQIWFIICICKNNSIVSWLTSLQQDQQYLNTAYGIYKFHF